MENEEKTNPEVEQYLIIYLLDNYFIVILISSLLLGLLFKKLIIKLKTLTQSNILKHKDKVEEIKTQNDDEEEDLQDKDIKMIFVCKMDKKLKPNYIAQQTAYLSTNLYKQILQSGTNYNKKVLGIWSYFGAKKIVLKIKSEKTDEEFEEIYINLVKEKIPCLINSEKNLLAAGPEISENLDMITGHLKLLS